MSDNSASLPTNITAGDNGGGMTTRDAAFDLLKGAMYFKDCSDELLTAMSETMVPLIATDGHIFMEEGAEIQYFMIVEEGVLARTKLAVDVETLDDMKNSIRSLDHEKRAAAIEENAILIDTVEGRGRVSGLLANLEEGNIAYATVTARGPAKVWLILGDDFRDLIMERGPFALELLNCMATEMRRGSNAVRAMKKQMKKIAQDAANQRGGGGSNKGDGPLIKVLCYDATSWVTTSFSPAIEAFNQAAEGNGLHIMMNYTTERLGPDSATYAAGYDAICTFVNDTANADVMQTLSLMGVKMIAQRAAGYDRIDIRAAKAHGFTVARVPKYSPYAVAEMAVSLLMAVNRKICKASNRVKMANFTLDEGLMGMDIHGKTVGIMGTGNIGQILCKIMLGFGANLICFDVFENEGVKAMGGTYVSQDEIYAQSDVLFIMMPLLPATYHTINHEVLPKLKPGVILINTSRGGLVHTEALLEGLRTGVIGGVGMDVYENEQDYFFQDWSARHIQDQELSSLLGNNNVVLTAHQAFFTKEAVDSIVNTTIQNLVDYHNDLRGTAHPNSCIPSQP